MEAISGFEPLPSPHVDWPADAASQHPWRLLRRALKWMLFAILASLLVIIVPAAIDGIRLGLAARYGIRQPQLTNYAALAPYGSVVLQVILLWGAVRGARVAASGDISAGLANTDVRRPSLVALLGLLILTWDISAISLVVWIVMHGGHGPAIPAQLAKIPAGLGAAVLHIVFLAVIAPICEEAFFRGWLWTALRKSWSPARTLCWTTGLWLAMHLMDGTWRTLMLIPTGLFLGLARHYGGSARASLTLHLMNNGLIVLVQIAALLAAGSASAG